MIEWGLSVKCCLASALLPFVLPAALTATLGVAALAVTAASFACFAVGYLACAGYVIGGFSHSSLNNIHWDEQSARKGLKAGLIVEAVAAIVIGCIVFCEALAVAAWEGISAGAATVWGGITGAWEAAVGYGQLAWAYAQVGWAYVQWAATGAWNFFWTPEGQFLAEVVGAFGPDADQKGATIVGMAIHGYFGVIAPLGIVYSVEQYLCEKQQLCFKFEGQ